MTRHAQLLRRGDSALLVVDIQTKINAVMFQGASVVEGAVKLIRGADILGVPVLFTEQYPEGLGPTEPRIVEALGDRKPIAKMSFSCCGAEPVLAALRENGAHQVVLCGIETHVCVLQTALDLAAADYQVHVPRDAVSSRKTLDHETALTRLGRAGVVVSTVESVLFEWLQRAGTPEFKQVAGLIK